MKYYICMVELAAKPRRELGKKAKRVRKTGYIPAVLYGYKVASQPVAVEARAFEKVLRKAGESSLVSLAIEGGETKDVLIHNIGFHPLTGVPEHVDFYAVRMDKPIEADITLEFIGESEAEKALGGILIKVMHEVRVRALPKNLPPELPVDISGLKAFEDRVFARDILLPEGVELLTDQESVVVLVESPRSEAEIEALEQAPGVVNLEGIEVAGKKEKEKEEREEGGVNEETTESKV